MQKSSCIVTDGFSLLEALFATTVLTVGVGMLAHLFVVATTANKTSRVTTFTAVLAQQKLEQLRGLTWSFDTLGMPVTDTATDTAVVPERSSGGTGLSPSPAGALRVNTPGYCDFLDAAGRSLGGSVEGAADPAGNIPTGTVFIRRWSVEPLPANPNTIILQVLVTTRRDRNAADVDSSVRRLPGDGRLTTARTRKAAR